MLLFCQRQAPTTVPAWRSKPASATNRSNRSRSDPRSMKPTRRGSAPRNTFSATVSRGTRATSWATRAIPRMSASRGDRNDDSRPPQHQVALILREDARDDLAQGGLAGAVLADERVDRAGADGDRHIIESARGPEGLAERAHLEMDVAVRRAGHDVSRERRPQPGHSASGRKVATLALVTTPPSGSDASGSTPAAGLPDRWRRSAPWCPGRLRWRASA